VLAMGVKGGILVARPIVCEWSEGKSYFLLAGVKKTTRPFRGKQPKERQSGRVFKKTVPGPSRRLPFLTTKRWAGKKKGVEY